MPLELRAFFDRYCQAFNSLDGEAVAALYAVPSGIVDERSFAYWATAEPIQKNMRALCELYQRDGYVSATYEPRAHIQQGNDFAVADVAWQIEWQGKAPSTFNTTYNLARTPDGWRVLLCTAYSEQRLS